MNGADSDGAYSAPIGEALEIDRLIERCYRHDIARITAVLAAQFGPTMIEAVEDATQIALTRAMENWRFAGAPANPHGWLYRSARNHLIDGIRRRATKLRHSGDPVLHDRIVGQNEHADAEATARFEPEIGDSEVRMMFACCHPEISLPGQVALALRLMGGFSVAEIARCLMTGEGTAAKRIQRARLRFSRGDTILALPDPDALPQRLHGVLAVIYAIFFRGLLLAASGIADPAAIVH